MSLVLKLFSVFALLLFATIAGAETTPPCATLDHDIRSAIASSGKLDPADLSLDPSGLALFGGDAFRLSIHRALTAEPLRAPAIVHAIADQALVTAGRPHDVLAAALSRTDHAVRVALLGDPTAEAARRALEPDAFRQAIVSTYTGGKRLQGKAMDDLRRRAAQVPENIGRLVAYLLYVTDQVRDLHGRAFENVSTGKSPFRPDSFEGLVMTFADSFDVTPPEAARRRVAAAAGTVGFEDLNAGAAILAFGVQSAAAMLDTLTVSSDVSFEWDTPLGRLAIGGSGADRYDGEYLLIIDAGGDDVYTGAGSVRAVSRPIAVILDRTGDDRYAPADSTGPGPAGALGGYAMIADLAGNDTYDSWTVGLGAALFGEALLWDRAGDDVYRSYAFGQGAALCGVGVLADDSGNDRYEILQAGQGFGATGGVGWLIDVTGNDIYTAADEPHAFPSAQAPEHNSSLAQGCASGVRADYLDGRSLAGGFGLLADGDGADRYTASVFGQGAGYWYGVGALVDRAGKDTYDGVWYVQGAAAHFAGGLLIDDAGDDVYTATRNMAQGAGHDLSFGILVDGAGNDGFAAPNLGLGAGNDNGLGLCADLGGDDRYHVRPDLIALGDAGRAGGPGVLNALRTIGVFIDFGGADAYPADRSLMREGAAWQSGARGVIANPLDRTVGIDLGSDSSRGKRPSR